MELQQVWWKSFFMWNIFITLVSHIRESVSDFQLQNEFVEYESGITLVGWTDLVTSRWSSLTVAILPIHF